jgi:hypothetical protein
MPAHTPARWGCSLEDVIPHPGTFARKVVAAHAEDARRAGVAEQGNAHLEITTRIGVPALFSR